MQNYSLKIILQHRQFNFVRIKEIVLKYIFTFCNRESHVKLPIFFYCTSCFFHVIFF